MPHHIERVKQHDPVSAKHYNRMVDEVNRLQRVAGDQYISVHNNACGIQLSFNRPVEHRQFQVSEDTPSGQNYLTALRLHFTGADNYTADQNENEIQVYDAAGEISTSSPLNPTNGAFPNYGTTSPRTTVQWTKKGFLGDARWEGNQGVWVVEWVEHIARWINFSYGGTGATYQFGSVDSKLSVTSFWHGLNPTVTTFTPSGGGQAKTNQIVILNAPNNGFTLKSGDSGTAFWRDDLDNSQFWQYQMIDGGRCPGT